MFEIRGRATFWLWLSIDRIQTKAKWIELKTRLFALVSNYFGAKFANKNRKIQCRDCSSEAQLMKIDRINLARRKWCKRKFASRAGKTEVTTKANKSKAWALVVETTFVKLIVINWLNKQATHIRPHFRSSSDKRMFLPYRGGCSRAIIAMVNRRTLRCLHCVIQEKAVFQAKPVSPERNAMECVPS